MADFKKQKLLAYTIPGIKQFDATACWAACLEWWAAATRLRIPRTGQLEILADYSHFWNPNTASSNYGTIPKPQLKKILDEQRWKADTQLISAQRLSHNFLRNKLTSGPVIIGFYSAFYQSGHVNVLVAPSTNREGREEGFIAMEPRVGNFNLRTYGFFSSDPNPVLLAWPKSN
jgi:hypothetical protein